MDEKSEGKQQKLSKEEWLEKMKRLMKEHPRATESEDGFLILDGPARDWRIPGISEPEEPKKN